jgi:hypothetical protein
LVPPPADALAVYIKDVQGGHKEAYLAAWYLACFIPFVNELNFRQRGATWSSANSEAYDAGARKLAMSCGLLEHMRYLPPNLLYGSALRWVGVERVMVFYKDANCFNRLPDVFKLRLETTCSSTALISNTRAAVNQLVRAGYWAHNSLYTISQCRLIKDLVIIIVSATGSGNIFSCMGQPVSNFEIFLYLIIAYITSLVGMIHVILPGYRWLPTCWFSCWTWRFELYQ